MVMKCVTCEALLRTTPIDLGVVFFVFQLSIVGNSKHIYLKQFVFTL